jgi:hypothetical protein
MVGFIFENNRLDYDQLIKFDCFDSFFIFLVARLLMRFFFVFDGIESSEIYVSLFAQGEFRVRVCRVRPRA